MAPCRLWATGQAVGQELLSEARSSPAAVAAGGPQPWPWGHPRGHPAPDGRRDGPRADEDVQLVGCGVQQEGEGHLGILSGAIPGEQGSLAPTRLEGARGGSPRPLISRK